MRSSSFVLSISLVLAACSGSHSTPDGGFDAGAVDAEVVQDAGCAPGELGCACDDGTCAAGACVSGTCTDCRIGAEACACRSDGTCSAGLRCEERMGVCIPCPEGEEGCACGAGCDEGLACEAGMCVADTCADGEVGCACASTEPRCEPGAFCDGTLCQACTADVAGCPCEGGACTGGLLCDADVCRAPITCADLRGAGTCGEHERCEEAAGTDAVCLSGMCDEGYRWSTVQERCVACVSAGCAEEPTCAPDLPASLDCGEHRLCVQGDIAGECGACEPGYADVGGECLEVHLCGGAACASGEYCDRSGATPTCTPWPCADTSTVVGSDGTCSVTCTRSCVVPGSSGAYWPYAASDDSCICETLPGYYFDSGGAIDPVACDADGDGWVREEVRGILDAPSPDPALIANARCAIREAGAVELVDEYGVTSVIESCVEGLLQDRTDGTCTVMPLRLFETKRNDVEGEAARLGEAPAYTAGGRRFHASELNSLTKACVTALGDFDDDGFEDVSQFQPRLADTSSLGERGRLRSFAHFIELYRTSWEPALAPSTYGRIVISERSRCGPFPLGYGADVIYDQSNGASYWRNCARRRHPGFDADTSEPGYDFAQWSCDTRAGSCPAPAMPAQATHAVFPDPDVELLRDFGTCELGGSAPADGVWRGMNHHSQFQCVAVVADGTAEMRSYEREQSSFAAGGALVFNACAVTDCAGDPACTDSRAPSVAPGAYDPLIACAHEVGVTPPPGAVGWAAVRYQPYGHVDPSGTPDGLTYAGGCINEDAEYPDLCPIPEFGACPSPAVDAFGRYHCYGWESLSLWANDDAALARSELAWAPDTGHSPNMSIFNPASAPVCM